MSAGGQMAGSSGWTEETCGADGGHGIGAGHVCKCVGKKGHEPYYGVGHGCTCGALWADAVTVVERPGNLPWETPNCGCGHRWEDHNKTVGCFDGWEYTGPDPGVASKEGCNCLLAHVERSNDDFY